MATDISGSYFGKSRPITQRILAGQGRGIGKANIVQNNVFYQQNNYGCCNRFDAYDYGCCGGDSGTPKWALWTMGIGGLLGALGNCFAGLRSSSSKPEGAGDAEPKDENAGLKDEIKALKQEIADLKKAGAPKPEHEVEDEDAPEDPNDNIKLPDVFTSDLMGNFNTWDDIAKAFKEKTDGADLYKLDTSKGITVNAILDKDKTTPDVNGLLGKINISADQLKGIVDANGKFIPLDGVFSNGMKVSARVLEGNPDSALMIKSGDQTYIVGLDGNDYKAYEFEGSNTDGNTLQNERTGGGA